ncbi:sterol desaturase family protein [Novosphingobium sp. BL-8A]|uniref:sterol desaturase family protein n=1 Tax=Novosphingobium sp. BL-8A TaxID=3127639 RepID=UPI003757DD77
MNRAIGHGPLQFWLAESQRHDGAVVHRACNVTISASCGYYWLDSSWHLMLEVDTMPALDPSPQRIRLFKSEKLEQLTFISPRTFAVAWAMLLPAIAWAGWGAVDPLAGCARVLVGLAVWTLFEYVMHRYMFHLETDVPILKWFVFLMHGNHHDTPNDPLRSLMPLSASVPIAATVWGIFALLVGRAGTWIFLGFMIGYVIYDVVHYACHHWPMRGKLRSALKRHHMRHHYLDEGGNYSISAIFWDSVFGSKIRSLKR